MTADVELRGLFDEALIVAEMARDVKERWAELRESAAPKGIDWSQLKALAVATDADHQDGGNRCGKLTTKADFACSYAGRLGLNSHKDERKTEIRSSSASRSAVRPTPTSLDAQTAGSEPADWGFSSAGSPKSAPDAGHREPTESSSSDLATAANSSVLDVGAKSGAAGASARDDFHIPDDLSIPDFLRRDHERLAS